jgi:hypothetical protein
MQPAQVINNLDNFAGTQQLGRKWKTIPVTYMCDVTNDINSAFGWDALDAAFLIISIVSLGTFAEVSALGKVLIIGDILSAATTVGVKIVKITDSVKRKKVEDFMLAANLIMTGLNLGNIAKESVENFLKQADEIESIIADPSLRQELGEDVVQLISKLQKLKNVDIAQYPKLHKFFDTNPTAYVDFLVSMRKLPENDWPRYASNLEKASVDLKSYMDLLKKMENNKEYGAKFLNRLIESDLITKNKLIFCGN